MADQHTCTEERTTAKSRQEAGQILGKVLAQLPRRPPKAKAQVSESGYLRGGAKDDIFHPTERTGWISLVPIKGVMLSLDVGPSFVLRS